MRKIRAASSWAPSAARPPLRTSRRAPRRLIASRSSTARRLALWIDNTDGAPATSIYDGTKWLPAVKLADKAQRLDLATDSAGNAFIVYPNGANTKAERAVLKAGTTSFIADEVAGYPALDFYNHVVAPLTTGAVVTVGVPGTPYALNAAQYNIAGSSWSALQPIAPLTGTNGPSAIASNGNRAAALLQSVTASTLDITTYDGTSWTAPARVPSATQAFSNGVVAVYANGDAYIVWQQPTSGSTIVAGVYGQRFHAATKTFDPVDELGKNKDHGFSEPQVLVDSRDHLTVAWEEATGSSTAVMAVARNIGAGFVKTELAGSVPLLGADPGGNVYALSSDINGTSRVFRVARDSTAWDAGAMLPLVVPSNQAQIYMSLVFDSAGKAEVFGRGNDNHVVQVTCQ